MRIVLLITMLFLTLGFTLDSYAATKIEVKGKRPQGVTIQSKKVVAKKGYYFEKVSSSRAVSRMRGGNGITGDFDCTCNGETGGCGVVTTPNSVTCVSNGCTNCYMIVSIPGTPAPAVMR